VLPQFAARPIKDKIQTLHLFGKVSANNAWTRHASAENISAQKKGVFGLSDCRD
jgi:hypothetical protein